MSTSKGLRLEKLFILEGELGVRTRRRHESPEKALQRLAMQSDEYTPLFQRASVSMREYKI